jgi:hypothetical protein
MQNETKLGRPWGIWRTACGWSLLCKTKPIPGGAGRLSLTPRPSSLAPTKPIARNEPNLGQPGQGADGRKMQNEPNLAMASRHPGANCAKRSQFGPAWAGPGTRRARDAKRTQFLPICRSRDRRSREGKLCETKPIAPEAPGRQVLCGERVMSSLTRRGSRQNKANFRPEGVPAGEGGPRRWRGSVCKTNPISQSLSGGTPNLRRANHAKQSQTWADRGIWGTASPSQGG